MIQASQMSVFVYTKGLKDKSCAGGLEAEGAWLTRPFVLL